MNDLVLRLMQSSGKISEFYEGLGPEDQQKAQEVLSEVSSTGLDWLANNPMGGTEQKVFNMMTQTGYGERFFSGPRSQYKQNIIDYFVQNGYGPNADQEQQVNDNAIY